MRKVLEFEKHASECRQLANNESRPVQKQKLLEMAEMWDRLRRAARTTYRTAAQRTFPASRISTRAEPSNRH